jgi:flagellar assembly protein FliH
MTAPLHRPFIFDTEFDADGGVVAETAFRPTKRSYLPSEVEALIAQARLEARQDALAEAAAIRDMALGSIAQALSQGLPGLAHAAQSHRAASADLSLAAARIIAGVALERLPEGPLRAALDALGQEIDASPRLVLRARGLDEEGRARIEAVCAEAGFTGQVSFRDDPGMAQAAFCLEWADGRAAFDPDEAAQRIQAALDAALAAEGGHGDSLIPPADHGAR